MEQSQRQVPQQPQSNGPLPVPQASTQEMAWVIGKIQQHDQLIGRMAQYNLQEMSGGKMIIIGGVVVATMVGVGFGTAALYNRWTKDPLAKK